MNVTLAAMAGAASTATLLGGLFALRLKDTLHLIAGFSAGAIIAVAFFEIIPESIALAGETYGIGVVASIMGLGFSVYLVLDRWILMHAPRDEDTGGAHRHASRRGTWARAASPCTAPWMASPSASPFASPLRLARSLPPLC